MQKQKPLPDGLKGLGLESPLDLQAEALHLQLVLALPSEQHEQFQKMLASRLLRLVLHVRRV